MSKIDIEHFDNLSAFSEIINFQTNRYGGLSSGNFESLNMTYSVGDNPILVLGNRQLLAKALGVDIDNFVFSHQTHSSNVEIITDRHRGVGVYDSKTSVLRDVDAMLTNEPELMLCMKIADCLPILLYDPVKRAVGVVHAGWRGVVDGIIAKSIRAMADHYGSSVCNIVAGIGVGAGICCYQVDQDVFTLLEKSVAGCNYSDFYRCGEGGKFFVDLKQISKIHLIEMGVKSENIEIKPECTICSSDRYFSVRANKGIEAGRIACGIMLK